MKNEFQTCIENNVSKKSTLVLGISGGPDSIYLLEQFLKIQKKIPVKLVIAHVNHGLRGKDSDTDAKFVKALANKLKLPYEEISLKLKNSTKSTNTEEAARNKRYEFLEKIREKYKAEWIITAHHLNDNIETVLFNLIRGAHFNGLKGMELASKERHLLRPLLLITKKEILAYLKSKKVKFRIDKSNNDIQFSRNLLRQKIIPLFQKINPNFENTFQNNLKNFTETALYLEKNCQNWLKEHVKDEVIHLEKFLNERISMQKDILVELYKKIHGSTNKLTHKHIEEILKILKLKKSNTKKEFGPHHFIRVDRKDDKSPRIIKILKK